LKSRIRKRRLRPKNRSRRLIYLKNLRIVLPALALLIGLTLLMSGVFSNNEDKGKDNNPISAEDNSESIEENITNIRIAAVGDIMAHDSQINSAYDEKTDSYDFKPFFEDVKPLILDADLAIGNLETTLRGSALPYSGYPMFNAPDEMVEALDYAGFDTLVTVNNHSLDTRAEGLKRTVETIREKGIDPVGTYDSKPDSRVLLKNVEGIKIALLAYTEHLNGMDASYSAEELNSMLNKMDKARIISDIEDAKALKPDIIIAYMHWGDEYDKNTNKVQASYAELLTREGVDIILGSHPHVIQRTEFMEVDGNKAFVAYSLGNFISNQRKESLGAGFEPTEDGVILNLDIQKNKSTGEVSIENVGLVPTWVYRNPTGSTAEGQPKYNYRILPIESFLNDSKLPKEYINRMKKSYEETISRMNIDNETSN
jgi:poly-gamma-glutamate capsule biosynthesis protein CapA/YwtB (metallophosphatase superfamily)